MIGFFLFDQYAGAAGLWLFHLLSKVEYETLLVTGYRPISALCTESTSTLFWPIREAVP